VKVKQGTEIARVDGKQIHFKDGSSLEADAIIFAYAFNGFVL
jgi:NADH dehydrogenase FAD-containing subunit